MRLRLAVLALLLPLAGLAGCDDDTESSSSDDPPAAWSRLPDLPLSPRFGPITVWTGTEVLAIGGDIGDPCPPAADCAFAAESATDGAALDPKTRTWRPLADAPLPIPAHTPAALASGHLFIRVDKALLDYDIRRNVWSTSRRDVSPWSDVVGDGDRLLLVSGSDEQHVRPDLVYDVRARRWSTLPEDPIGKAFDRSITPTSHGLVLTAHGLVPNPGAEKPTFLLAAVLDRTSGRWRRLPDADIIGGGGISVIGDRLILPSLDATNGGGDGDYGRMVRLGGRLDLTSGEWSRLPHAPKYLSGGWPVDAPDGGRLLAAGGWIYDDASGTWAEVPRPAGSAEASGPAVWAGDRLIVVGSSTYRKTAAKSYQREVWTWTPAVGAFQ